MMLAYLLAIAVGLGSFGLYLAAFFFPEVHRRYDLIWSGVGMFYALVLWVCAGRITGGVLLGQMASVALLGWFGWQTLKLRRVQTPLAQQTQLPESTNSTSEVFQATVQQLRTSFQKSADRSILAAQLDKWLAWSEEAWVRLGHWINTSVSTTSEVPEQGSPTAVTNPSRLENLTQTSAKDDPDASWRELQEINPEREATDSKVIDPYGFDLPLDAESNSTGTRKQL